MRGGGGSEGGVRGEGGVDSVELPGEQREMREGRGGE